jgi:hypothetical protein
MAYDHKTYGASPFGTSVTTTHRTSSGTTSSQGRDAAEALSDHMEDHSGDQPAAEHPTADNPERDVPALPADYAAAIKPRNSAVSFFYIPRGRVTGLNLLGEALGWLMAWGTVGFFRAYVPPPVLMLFDRLFNPYGMACMTLLSALFIGQMLRRYQLNISALRSLATTAIEYGETNHRADTQTHIDELLSAAAAQTEQASRWLVSWLTALGCLFIIGAFY